MTNTYIKGLLILQLLQTSAPYDCDKPDLPMENGMYVIPNAKPKSRNDDYAIGTTPKGFSIRLSTIEVAGLGAFAETAIPKNTRIGPYEGIVYNGTQDQSKDWTYSWSVNFSPVYLNESKHHVDAMERAHSSWLRYINMPNTIDQENLYVLQLNYDIYYVTYECIKPGTELMVWYGDDYGKYLGLKDRKPQDYIRRFGEPHRRSEYENRLPFGPVERITSDCYMFTHQCPAEKQVYTQDGYSYLCVPGITHDICKYRKCDRNPCSGKSDCKECKGFCFHMGHYIEPDQDFAHADGVNGCLCTTDGDISCSDGAWSFQDMCVY